MDTPETRAFFVPGRKYRVPNYLATSFDKGVTTAFLGRVKFSGPVNALVLWKVQVNRFELTRDREFMIQQHMWGCRVVMEGEHDTRPRTCYTFPDRWRCRRLEVVVLLGWKG